MPSLSSTGHSMAGSVFGEGVMFFGFFGFVAAGVTLAVVIGALNKGISWVSLMTPERQLVIGAALALTNAQLVSLVWGGLFTFLVRSLSPMFVAAALLILIIFLIAPSRRIVKSPAQG